jgi:putative oxidoreductase
MAVNGVEFPLFWLFILIAVLLRGGGPYSLDRKIGKEI